MAAATRVTWRGGCCAWHPRISATLIRAPWRLRCSVETYERLGGPEGELAIAQAVVFMACAAKSNAVYVAFGAAMTDAKQHGTLDVPLRLATRPRA